MPTSTGNAPKSTINNMDYNDSQSNFTNQNSQTLQITLTNLTTTSINKTAHKDKLTHKPHTQNSQSKSPNTPNAAVTLTKQTINSKTLISLTPKKSIKLFFEKTHSYFSQSLLVTPYGRIY